MGFDTVRFIRFLAIALAIACGACDDGFGPRSWDATPDTVTLFSVSRPELAFELSAYDAFQGISWAIESPGATGQWDFALAEQGGQFVMAPAGSFGGIASRAGIATIGLVSLEEVREAPNDTARFASAPVPITVGTVYVLRTRRASCPELFGSAGIRYAKLAAIALDSAAGTFRFAVVRNPICNDRALVPPEE